MLRISSVAALAVALSSSVAVAEPLDSDAISDVAENVVTSVVNIASTRTVDIDFGPFASDPFFNDPRSPWYVSPEQRSQEQKSLGSGVIVTEKGRVLTNAHVVNGAEEIEVTLSDGTELPANVIGVDTMSDIAVLQLEGDVPALKPIELGDSSKLRLGEVVLAVGDPFGVGQAVTMGIVSAKGRGGLGIEEYEDFIQTDAAINPGNSGGALVNLDGQLVGINTAIASRSGGYDGIGFAIPTSMVVPIMDMLVKDGKVVRGYIGVQLASLTKQWKKDHAVTAKRGVGVELVLEDGPAARAGLEAGDVIVAVDGNDVKDVSGLRNRIAMAGSGAKMELTVMRGKEKSVLEVTTQTLPGKEDMAGTEVKEKKAGEEAGKDAEKRNKNKDENKKAKKKNAKK